MKSIVILAAAWSLNAAAFVASMPNGVENSRPANPDFEPKAIILPMVVIKASAPNTLPEAVIKAKQIALPTVSLPEIVIKAKQPAA